MTLLGLSLAIGVLIDDAIVVRENIVRHMERGEDRITAARNGTAEIGLAVTATTFSIIAVFVPVAFMGGVAGEWFRPFARHGGDLGAGEPVHLLHARPDAVGVLGRSAGPRAARAKRGIGKVLAKLQRVVRPPGRSLRQRHRLGAASPQVDGGDRGRAAWSARSCCRSTVGGSELPAEVRRRHDRDRRAHALERSLEYAKLKVEKAAELARTHARDQGHQQPASTPSGGRVYVDIGKSTSATARPRRSRRELREQLDAAGRRRVRRARRPQQRRAASRCRSSSTARTRAG